MFNLVYRYILTMSVLISMLSKISLTEDVNYRESQSTVFLCTPGSCNCTRNPNTKLINITNCAIITRTALPLFKMKVEQSNSNEFTDYITTNQKYSRFLNEEDSDVDYTGRLELGLGLLEPHLYIDVASDDNLIVVEDPILSNNKIELSHEYQGYSVRDVELLKVSLIGITSIGSFLEGFRSLKTFNAYAPDLESVDFFQRGTEVNSKLENLVFYTEDFALNDVDSSLLKNAEKTLETFKFKCENCTGSLRLHFGDFEKLRSVDIQTPENGFPIGMCDAPRGLSRLSISYRNAAGNVPERCLAKFEQLDWFSLKNIVKKEKTEGQSDEQAVLNVLPYVPDYFPYGLNYLALQGFVLNITKIVAEYPFNELGEVEIVDSVIRLELDVDPAPEVHILENLKIVTILNVVFEVIFHGKHLLGQESIAHVKKTQSFPQFSVEFLRMRNCGMTEFGAFVIANMPKLKVLDLRNNDISTIRGVFGPAYATGVNTTDGYLATACSTNVLSGLTDVFLSENNISSLDPYTFCRAPALSTLDLAANRIRRLDAFSLRSYQQFGGAGSSGRMKWNRVWDVIDLSMNFITHLPDGLLGEQSTRVFQIEHNALTHVTTEFCAYGQVKCQIAQTLSFKGNLMTSIDLAWGGGANFSGLAVDLSQNRLAHLSGVLPKTETQFHVLYGLMANGEGPKYLNASNNLLFGEINTLLFYIFQEVDLSSNAFTTVSHRISEEHEGLF